MGIWNAINTKIMQRERFANKVSYHFAPLFLCCCSCGKWVSRNKWFSKGKNLSCTCHSFPILLPFLMRIVYVTCCAVTLSLLRWLMPLYTLLHRNHTNLFLWRITTYHHFVYLLLSLCYLFLQNTDSKLHCTITLVAHQK